MDNTRKWQRSLQGEQKLQEENKSVINNIILDVRGLDEFTSLYKSLWYRFKASIFMNIFLFLLVVIFISKHLILWQK